MSSKTKIVVLHMKEIIYTVIFAVLAIVLILLLIFMFRPGHHSGSNDKKIYTPGIYTSDITLNNTAFEVEVTVDETHINKKQSLENIQYSSDTPYTSQLIVQAIENALKKAETTK